MQTYNIHEAKTHLSRLVDQAAQGESFVIAKSGKPMVRVVALDAPDPARIKRFGFLSGAVRQVLSGRLSGRLRGFRCRGEVGGQLPITRNFPGNFEQFSV